MILGRLDSILDITMLPSALYKGLKYLKETDFSALKDGEYEIEGRDIYAKVFSAESKELKDANAEYHEQYIDIQYWLSGCELMGWKAKECKDYKLKHSDDDLFLVDEELIGEKFIEAVDGDFMILFPSDIHRPQVKLDNMIKYRKVVIKVNKDLIN